jgi:hypothetical protein
MDRGSLEARVREWRGLLRGAPQRARQILRKRLPDRLRLDRTPEGYRFSGQIAVTGLFAGIASPVSVVPPEGHAAVWSVEIREIVRAARGATSR